MYTPRQDRLKSDESSDHLFDFDLLLLTLNIRETLKCWCVKLN